MFRSRQTIRYSIEQTRELQHSPGNPFFLSIHKPQIDLQELMQAFKQHRTAMNYLSKNSQQRSGVPVGVGSGTKSRESVTSPKMGNPAENRGHDERCSGPELEGSRCQMAKEERSLFSPEESKLLTAYVVETQQAFSQMSVVDIQQGEIDVCDKTRAFKLLLIRRTYVYCKCGGRVLGGWLLPPVRRRSLTSTSTVLYLCVCMCV